jgi:hypothetical protein
MSLHILEKLQIVGGFVPVDLQTAANTGDYVSFKNYGRCAVVFFKAAGTAGDDPTITLTQAQDVAGTGVKNLTFDRIDVKQGTLTAIGQFTQLANTDHDYTEATSAEAQALWVIDVKAEDLDIANGFDCLKAAVGDVGGNAQLGSLLYLLHEPRFASVPLPSAIAN